MFLPADAAARQVGLMPELDEAVAAKLAPEVLTGDETAPLPLVADAGRVEVGIAC